MCHVNGSWEFVPCKVDHECGSTHQTVLADIRIVKFAPDYGQTDARVTVQQKWQCTNCPHYSVTWTPISEWEARAYPVHVRN